MTQKYKGIHWWTPRLIAYFIYCKYFHDKAEQTGIAFGCRFISSDIYFPMLYLYHTALLSPPLKYFSPDLHNDWTNLASLIFLITSSHISMPTCVKHMHTRIFYVLFGMSPGAHLLQGILLDWENISVFWELLSNMRVSGFRVHA